LPETVAAPFYDDIAKAPAGGKVFWRNTSDNVRIRVGVWQGGKKGTFFIFTGRSEYIEKYGPTIQRLLGLGYCVVICDWRCQGLSDRLDEDQTLGHVADFYHYQLDVAEMLSVANEMSLPRKRYILAHSMGGAIALRSLHESLIVHKVIFSAPFWDAYMSAGLRAYANVVTAFAPSIGLASARTPTTSSGAYVELFPFEGNALTNDEDSYAWQQRQVSRYPELSIGGPSLGWLAEALKETRYFQLIDMALPDCLCFLGTNEKIVSSKAIYRIMKKWKNGELVVIEGAQHEVLLETPEVLEQVWTKISGFLAD
jgi:lysophospholipase